LYRIAENILKQAPTTYYPISDSLQYTFSGPGKGAMMMMMMMMMIMMTKIMCLVVRRSPRVHLHNIIIPRYIYKIIYARHGLA